MPNEEQLNQMTLFFKSFADSTRLRLLSALLEAEMCVCDLAALIDMSQSAISHQLRILRQARLVKTRRDGKVIYYSLDDDHVDHVMRLVIDHLEHD